MNCIVCDLHLLNLNEAVTKRRGGGGGRRILNSPSLSLNRSYCRRPLLVDEGFWGTCISLVLCSSCGSAGGVGMGGGGVSCFLSSWRGSRRQRRALKENIQDSVVSPVFKS